MDKNIRLVESLTSSGVVCPMLNVHETIEIEDENVVHYANSNTKYLVPIKLAISYKITDAKNKLLILEQDKGKINTTKKHIKLLNVLISNMDKFNNSSLNEDCEYLYIFDGLTDERKLVRDGFIKQKELTEITLDGQTSNYKTTKKQILLTCLEEVSLLLKQNGMKKHRDSASVILKDNGIDIPPSY